MITALDRNSKKIWGRLPSSSGLKTIDYDCNEDNYDDDDDLYL